MWLVHSLLEDAVPLHLLYVQWRISNSDQLVRGSTIAASLIQYLSSLGEGNCIQEQTSDAYNLTKSFRASYTLNIGEILQN